MSLNRRESPGGHTMYAEQPHPSLAMVQPHRPARPIADFGPVEAAIGTSLPDDYKALAQLFEAGDFGDGIRLECIDEQGLTSTARSILDVGRRRHADSPDDLPHPMYPRACGLLPWAVTDGGDVFAWLPCGEPGDWTVVRFNLRGGSMEPFDCGAVEFLSEYLEGQSVSPV